jgi:hypothetical protein
MTHRVIIYDSSQPSSTDSAAAVAHVEPMIKVRVEYRPDDSATPEQIGKEMERIVRKAAQIEAGGSAS